MTVPSVKSIISSEEGFFPFENVASPVRAIARIVIIALAVLAAMGVAYVLWSQSKAEIAETIRPVRKTAILAVYGTGVVEPRYWSKVSAVRAGRLTKILKQEGDRADRGEIVAVQDDRVERAQLKEFEAQLEYYRRDFARQSVLVAKNVGAKAKRDLAKAKFDEFTARVATQKRRISELTIRSPMAGTVLRRDGELGEYLTPGQVLFWIGKPDELQVVANIDEEDIALVAPGQTALMKADAFPGEAIDGRVREITPKGDPVAKNFRMKIQLPKGTKLLVGMTVEVNVVVRREPNALMVPVDSVKDGQVLVLEADGKFKARAVKTGIVNNELVQIVDGLRGDEQLLAHPQGGSK